MKTGIEVAICLIHEDLVWTAEMQLLNDIKGNFEIGIGMIESGEAERQIIQEENW